MTDFIGTNEQLCNALNHIEKRASTSHTDIIVVAAAQARIAELEAALKSILEIPNSEAAQGIMKVYAFAALGDGV
jgi:hypothetical protein